jgi:hypothetical protein
MRYRRCALALLVVMTALTPVIAARQVAKAGERPCDRACLRGLLTQYLDALVAHTPNRLPLANRVRFTEDTVEKRPGEGLWQTAGKLRPYRQDILDVRAGVAGTHTIVEENGAPVLFALRLKVLDRTIAEVETMVVRSREEGMIFQPDAFTQPTAAMNVEPAAGQRTTREEAIRIAQLYPAGLRAGSFVTVDLPFAEDAYRFENGRLMAGPGCTFLAGCTNIKTQRIPTLPEVVSRVAAVDEDLGIVWLRMDFGAGSVPDKTTRSLTVWEAFKVYGGQIHAVEALMEVMPRGSSSGWDGRDDGTQ